MSIGDAAASCTKISPGDRQVKCLMCLSTDNDPFLYGDIYECGKIVAHYFCLVSSHFNCASTRYFYLPQSFVF